MKKVVLILCLILIVNQTTISQNFEKWDNPVLIQGSSFGSFFQQLYKQGMYNEMLRFTSKKSIGKYGEDSILKYYSSMDFGYKMKLKSRTINSKTNVTTLNYESDIIGGKHITRINVVVENDTCRILLDNTLFNLVITWVDVKLNQYR